MSPLYIMVMPGRLTLLTRRLDKREVLVVEDTSKVGTWISESTVHVRRDRRI